MTWFLDTSAMQPAPCGTSKKSQLLQKTYAAIPGSLAYLHIDIHIMIDLHTRAHTHTPTHLPVFLINTLAMFCGTLHPFSRVHFCLEMFRI